jgi:hypothetical protein
MSLIGKIARYKVMWNSSIENIFTAIVVDYREGYHVKKLWGDNPRFIDCPLIKLFWLNKPYELPPSALKRMSIDWCNDPQYSFGFIENTNNYIIQEWEEFKSEWYYTDIFEVEE